MSSSVLQRPVRTGSVLVLISLRILREFSVTSIVTDSFCRCGDGQCRNDAEWRGSSLQERREMSALPANFLQQEYRPEDLFLMMRFAADRFP